MGPEAGGGARGVSAAGGSPALACSKITLKHRHKSSVFSPPRPVVTRCHCRKKSARETDARARDINVWSLRKWLPWQQGARERTSFFADTSGFPGILQSALQTADAVGHRSPGVGPKGRPRMGRAWGPADGPVDRGRLAVGALSNLCRL